MQHIRHMATLTIRNLDDKTKQALRERAAKNGRSMEEEARILLGKLDSQKLNDLPGSQISDISDTDPFDFDEPALIDKYYPATGKKVLLIITGSVAAYKSLDLIRRLKERGVGLDVVMTKAASEFISPLQIGALSHTKVYVDLFNREDEHDVGHIRLARDADLIVVAPATGNMIAKMAHGLGDDLASAILLAAKNKILLAPAMNPAMWNNPATKRNVAILLNDQMSFIGPDSGEMAENKEAGCGRFVDTMDIVTAIGQILDGRPKPLAGLNVILTAGPTHEPIDPVRYLANRSSGKQGYAIAGALAGAGAKVKLISGPVNLAVPAGVDCIKVESANQMFHAVEDSLPADIAIMVAAVADWRVANRQDEKIKKKPGDKKTLSLKLTQNPDILKTIARHKKRPALVIGFAAETQNIITHAKAKLARKGADWILANDVSAASGIMGGDDNKVTLLSKSGVEEWPFMSKYQVADNLVAKIVSYFETQLIDV